MQRPRSVTVIAWLLIALGAINLVTVSISLSSPEAMGFLARSPIPVSVQIVFGYTGLAVTIVSGAFMLRRANWARHLYIWWAVVGFIVSVVSLGLSPLLVLGGAKSALFIVLLTRRNASAYFRQAERPGRSASE